MDFQYLGLEGGILNFYNKPAGNLETSLFSVIYYAYIEPCISRTKCDIKWF